MKFLCAADLHLGRLPSRLPSALFDRLGSAGATAELTPATAWRGLIEAAIEREVHAVLLAGDVLDDEHDFFESFGDLKAGVEQLVAAGITVLAVSGNHDVEVLPRLARAVPELVLLGEGGRWETHTLTDGSSSVHVVGWSYPTRTVTHSPLATLSAALAGLAPAPVIGLLHCDRDQSGSRYAPVTSAELAAAPVEAWLLGHVHRPDVVAFADVVDLESGALEPATAISGYLGSIFAADPGEEGARGAWLLDVSGEGITLEPLPLSPLRFESVTVDVGGLRDAADVGQLVVDALAATHERLRSQYANDDAGPVAVACSVSLTGRSALRSELAVRLGDDDPRELLLTLGGVRYFVHDVSLEVLPAIDLAAVSEGSDPLALVARKLLVLDGPPSEEQNQLLEDGRVRLAATAAGRHYRGLEPPGFSDAVVTDHLRQAALRLIDIMAERRYG